MGKPYVYLLAIVLSLGLPGCAGKPSVEPAETQIPVEIQNTDGIQGILSGTASFQVLVPPGWSALPVKDVFAEDPDAVKENCLFLIKGGETEQDLHSKLYVQIQYYGPGVTLPDPAMDTYQNIQAIEPVTLGEYIWQGFIAEDLQGRAVLGKAALLWTDRTEGNFLVSCYLERGRECISLEDPEVQYILASLTPAGP